jgi:hypothetical protein
MATSSADKVIDAIAERITERRRIYDAAMEADVTLLCRAHGTGLVVEALQRLKEPPRPSASWDARAHRAEVSRAVNRLIERKARDPDAFDDATKI